ncbi:hypothetical protein MKW92_034613, partial [Papaver armeniacum]
DHTLQLDAFSVAIEKLDPNSPRPKLQFMGSCRNQEEEQRLQKLKERDIEPKAEKDVEFYRNLMYRYNFNYDIPKPILLLLNLEVNFIDAYMAQHSG